MKAQTSHLIEVIKYDENTTTKKSDELFSKMPKGAFANLKLSLLRYY